jgi:hypothetical protein
LLTADRHGVLAAMGHGDDLAVVEANHLAEGHRARVALGVESAASGAFHACQPSRRYLQGPTHLASVFEPTLSVLSKLLP